MSTKIVDPEIISQILDRYERGQSVYFVAFALGINHKTVSRILHERIGKLRGAKPIGKQIASRPRRRP